MKKGNTVRILLTLFLCALLFCGCSLFIAKPDNKPYEPDTPAPSPHDGSFVSEHGTMRFYGDGEKISFCFDEYLAKLCGLPEGEQEGTYVFLSGDLPPHGSIPVRYDTAHELRITSGEVSVVISLGFASENGKTASSYLGMVTPERIPLLFNDGGNLTILFEKQTDQ